MGGFSKPRGAPSLTTVLKLSHQTTGCLRALPRLHSVGEGLDVGSHRTNCTHEYGLIFIGDGGKGGKVRNQPPHILDDCPRSRADATAVIVAVGGTGRGGGGGLGRSRLPIRGGGLAACLKPLWPFLALQPARAGGSAWKWWKCLFGTWGAWEEHSQSRLLPAGCLEAVWRPHRGFDRSI